MLKLVLKFELASANSPRTLLDVLKTIHRRKHLPMQVDCLISKKGMMSVYVASIPFVIAKCKRSTSTKLMWVKAIMNDTELSACFDLNRSVGYGGNLVVNSYVELHIYDVEWYAYLLHDLRLAVNSMIKQKTLKDYILQDVSRGKAPGTAKTLLKMLETCGGKTRTELKH